MELSINELNGITASIKTEINFLRIAEEHGIPTDRQQAVLAVLLVRIADETERVVKIESMKAKEAEKEAEKK